MACRVCTSPALAEINAKLASGVSYRTLATEYDLPYAAIQRHKAHANQATSTSGSGVGESAESSSNRSESGTESPEARSAAALESLPPDARPTPVVVQKALRVETIANLIANGDWDDRKTVLALMAKWGCTEKDVIRAHRIAATHVAAARGPIQAQLESSMAWLKVVRNEEMETAREFKAEATKLHKAKDYLGARTALMNASTARKVALQAQKQADSLTVARPPATMIQVAIQANPNFAGAYEIIYRILSALFPERTPEIVDAGLAAWEEGGEEGFGRWLGRQRPVLSLAAGPDGTFTSEPVVDEWDADAEEPA